MQDLLHQPFKVGVSRLQTLSPIDYIAIFGQYFMVPTLVHILKKSFFDFYRGMFLRAILRLQPNLLRHPLPVMGAMLSYAAKDGQVVQVHTGNWAELVEMRSLEDVAFDSSV